MCEIAEARNNGVTRSIIVSLAWRFCCCWYFARRAVTSAMLDSASTGRAGAAWLAMFAAAMGSSATYRASAS